jgi:hypothetical protein
MVLACGISRGRARQMLGAVEGALNPDILARRVLGRWADDAVGFCGLQPLQEVAGMPAAQFQVRGFGHPPGWLGERFPLQPRLMSLGEQVRDARGLGPHGLPHPGQLFMPGDIGWANGGLGMLRPRTQPRALGGTGQTVPLRKLA